MTENNNNDNSSSSNTKNYDGKYDKISYKLKELKLKPYMKGKLVMKVYI